MRKAARFKRTKLDVYTWVVKVIRSCVTHRHFMTSKNLVDNFNCTYKDAKLEEKLDYHIDLVRKRKDLLILPYTWEHHRPIKPCICDQIRKHGGSGWCHIHHTDWA